MLRILPLLVQIGGTILELGPEELARIRASSRPAYVKIDPASCGDACDALEPFWEMVDARLFPGGRVWRLRCGAHPDVCAELGAGFRVDVVGSLVEAWTGAAFERFAGEKNLDALVGWLRRVEDGTLARELATARSRPPRDLRSMPAIAATPRRRGAPPALASSASRASSPALCAALLRRVNETLASSIAAVEAGTLNETDAFGRVHERRHRYDVKLPLVAETEAALHTLAHTLRPLVASAVGDAAELFDLSSVVADPGAAEQPLHPDQAWTDAATVVTVFVALQDVAPDMGPTLFVPGTASAATRERQNLKQHVALLDAGDAAVFDARISHAGAANGSARRRVMFYVSFKAAGARAGATSSESGGSLLGAVSKRGFTLADLAGTDPAGEAAPGEL
ncbi:phytanoyl-CoA dioxygenase [Aureococcus anophagefferens]|nr:phytanoyl-CoA dioxygenase [Aureococcus anophagefferens]